MAQSFVSLITLAALVAASPIAVRQVDPNNCVQIYTVPGGVSTTCSNISSRFGIPPWALQEANPTINCDDIWEYTQVCIPPGNFVTASPSATPSCRATYISVAGDTCDSIAPGWGLYPSDILTFNNFLDCDNLWVGTPICIPDFVRETVTSSVPIPTETVPAGGCALTYTSVDGDTCDSIGARFGISGGAVYNSNNFLDCGNVWPWTPVCIPYIVDPWPTAVTDPPPFTSSSVSSLSAITGSFSLIRNCQFTYYSVAGDTCDSIGAKFSTSGDRIHLYNDFLTCDDVWTNTPICVPPVESSVPPPVPTSTAPSQCPVTYTSVEGDTCDSIGEKFNVPGSVIYEYNNFVQCEDIWPWTPICIGVFPEVLPTATVI